jgi:hypothetical protein
LALALGLLVGGSALAQDEPASPAEAVPTSPAAIVATLAGDRPGVAQRILVGESGQLYWPQTDGTWRRDRAGGVAVDVRGATRVGDVVYAVGPHTPLFERRDGVWHVRELSVHGRMRVASHGALPALAVRNQVYVFAAGIWVRFGPARARIAALWAASRKQVFVADDRGEIARSDGHGWVTLRGPKLAHDAVTQFLGGRGSSLYAITDAGNLWLLRKNQISPVVAPAELSGLRAEVGCATDGDRAVFVGASGGDPPTTWHVLAVDQAEPAPIATLPAPSPEDPYAACAADATGGLLIVTRSGRVHVRAADGVWRESQVVTEPPAPAPSPIRAARRPALTQ